MSFDHCAHPDRLVPAPGRPPSGPPRRLARRGLALGMGLGLGLGASAATLAVAGPAGASTARQTKQFPAVRNATNLKVEPRPGKGHRPTPKKFAERNLVVGHGTAATATSTVEVQYVGTSYTTGKIFDASWTDSGETSFSLAGGVIPGFTKGITGMKVGGRREMVLPAALAYGTQGTPDGTIRPNETLVFVVDLLGVEPASSTSAT